MRFVSYMVTRVYAIANSNSKRSGKINGWKWLILAQVRRYRVRVWTGVRSSLEVKRFALDTFGFAISWSSACLSTYPGPFWTRMSSIVGHRPNIQFWRKHAQFLIRIEFDHRYIPIDFKYPSSSNCPIDRFELKIDILRVVIIFQRCVVCLGYYLILSGHHILLFIILSFVRLKQVVRLDRSIIVITLKPRIFSLVLTRVLFAITFVAVDSDDAQTFRLSRSLIHAPFQISIDFHAFDFNELTLSTLRVLTHSNINHSKLRTIQLSSINSDSIANESHSSLNQTMVSVYQLSFWFKKLDFPFRSTHTHGLHSISCDADLDDMQIDWRSTSKSGVLFVCIRLLWH